MFYHRIFYSAAAVLALTLFAGCGITGGTSARKMPLNPALGAASLAHPVRVGTVGARSDAGVNRAIGTYNWGKFDGSDLATLQTTLERSLPSAARSRHTVHVIVQHFGLTFTNNRGACLALIDWCVVEGPQIIMSERFYAAYDTGDKLFGTETMGMAKNRVLHAAAARIAERSLAAANGMSVPPAPDLTFDDPIAANATLPKHMTAAAGSGAVAAVVQQTMLGGLDGATRLLPDPIPPAPDWPNLLR
jgi:hypothetical protein